MSALRLPLSELAASLLRNVFQAVTDSVNDQNASFAELAALVAVPSDAHQDRLLGRTAEERRLTAERYVRDVVFPLCSLPDRRLFPRRIFLTDEARRRLIEHFRGVTALLGADGEGRPAVIEEAIRRAGAQGRWTLALDPLVRFALALLLHDAEFSYRETRALLASGLPKATVTTGQLTAKIVLYVATVSAPPLAPAPASPAGAGPRRARFPGRGEPRAANVIERFGRLKPLDLRVRVANERSPDIANAADLIGAMRLEFRMDSFPQIETRAP